MSWAEQFESYLAYLVRVAPDIDRDRLDVLAERAYDIVEDYMRVLEEEIDKYVSRAISNRIGQRLTRRLSRASWVDEVCADVWRRVEEEELLLSDEEYENLRRYAEWLVQELQTRLEQIDEEIVNLVLETGHKV